MVERKSRIKKCIKKSTTKTITRERDNSLFHQIKEILFLRHNLTKMGKNGFSTSNSSSTHTCTVIKEILLHVENNSSSSTTVDSLYHAMES